MCSLTGWILFLNYFELKIEFNKILEYKLKTFLSFFLLLALIFLGCAETGVSPLDPENKPYELIKLPPKSGGLTVENTYSKTEIINGQIGGTIEIDESYIAADGHTVKMYARITIPENAFKGEVPIEMTIDDEYAAVWFSPHLIFDIPVELKMSFKGIDLEELILVNGQYYLLFIADDGSYEVVEYDEVQVIESQGEIRVQKAYLQHFSRYGFTR